MLQISNPISFTAWPIERFREEATKAINESKEIKPGAELPEDLKKNIERTISTAAGTNPAERTKEIIALHNLLKKEYEKHKGADELISSIDISI